MATRATNLSDRHVEALNAIEVEFSSGKGSDKKVWDAWHVYLDQLNAPQPADPNDRDGMARWTQRSNDLFLELLCEMSTALGYSFDKVSLKNSLYYPKGHGDVETEQYLLRKFVLEVMGGKRPLWTGVITGERPLQMEITNWPGVPGDVQDAREIGPAR